MPQTSVTRNQPIAYPGLLASPSADFTDSKKNIAVTMPFGVVAVQKAGQDDACRLPLAGTAVITFSGALITANSVAGIINGVALTATVFATDDATTLAAIATKIAAQPHILSATAGTNKITVVASPDYPLAVTGVVVTAGASQVTATIVHTCLDRFLGVTRHQHIAPLTIGGTSQYEANSMVSIAKRARIWVNAESACDVNDTPYVRFMAGSGGSQLGAIGNTADSGTCMALPNAKFNSTALIATPVQLDISNP